MHSILRFAASALVFCMGMLVATSANAQSEGVSFRTTRIMVEQRGAAKGNTGFDVSRYKATQVSVDPDGDPILAVSSYVSLLRLFAEARNNPQWGEFHVIGASTVTTRTDSNVSTDRTRLDELKAVQKLIAPLISGSGTYKLDGDPGVVANGYKEAYLQMKRVRAFPYTEIDYSKYTKAYDARERLVRNLKTGGGSPRPDDVARILPSGVVGPANSATLNTWESVGPRFGSSANNLYGVNHNFRPMTGRIGAAATHPTIKTTIYAGGANGGVAKSIDGGATWNHVSQPWPGDSVSSIWVSPTNPNIIVAGTGDYAGNGIGYGIMRSTDGGNTWVRISPNPSGTSAVTSIVHDPSTPTTVYASTSGGAGLLKSLDSGATWTALGLTGVNFNQLVWQKLTSPTKRLYFSGRNAGAPCVGYTTDGGATFTFLTVPGAPPSGEFHVDTSKIFSNVLYMIEYDRKDAMGVAIPGGRFLKSGNGGGSWNDLTSQLPDSNFAQAPYNIFLNTFAMGSVDGLMMGNVNLYFSTTAGESWRYCNGPLFGKGLDPDAQVHNDAHVFELLSSSTNAFSVLVGTDGGLTRINYNKTTDALTYSRINAGLQFAHFYQMDVANSSPNYIAGGTQDNGTPIMDGDPLRWNNALFGDGAGAAIRQSATSTQIAQSQNGNVQLTFDRWINYDSINPVWTGHLVPFICAAWSNPLNDDYFYVGTDSLNRYQISTGTWTRQGPNAGPKFGNFVVAMGFSTISSLIFWAATDVGRIYRTADGGTTWVDVTGALPVRAITGIAPRPGSTSEVMITVSGTGTSHVFRSTNADSNSATWDPVGNGLPDLPTNTIVRDATDPVAVLYVGNDLGVYRSTDGGNTWSDYSVAFNLPPVRVNTLKSLPDGTLYAATWGRGIWRKRPAGLAMSLSANESAIVPGKPITFTLNLDYFSPLKDQTLFVGTSIPGVLPNPINPVVLKNDAKSVSFVLTPVASTATPVLVAVVVNGATVTVELNPTPNNGIEQTLYPAALFENTGTVTRGSIADLGKFDQKYMSIKMTNGKSVGTEIYVTPSMTTLKSVQVNVRTKIESNPIADPVYELSLFGTDNKYHVIGTVASKSQMVEITGNILNAQKFLYGGVIYVRVLCRPSSGRTVPPTTLSIDMIQVKARGS